MSRLLPVLHASCAEGGKATASLHPAEEHLAAVVDFAAKASRRPRRHHRAAHRAMAWRDGRTSARCCVSVTLRGARPPSRILSRQSRNQKRVAKARPSRRNGRGCLKTSPLLRRNAMHSFLRKFAGAVRGVLCGLDRVFLRGTLRGVAYTKGLQSFLCSFSITLIRGVSAPGRTVIWAPVRCFSGIGNVRAGRSGGRHGLAARGCGRSRFLAEQIG